MTRCSDTGKPAGRMPVASALKHYAELNGTKRKYYMMSDTSSEVSKFNFQKIFNL